ncbi:MAG: beta-ketoacyl synthase N-terminal-like domain-containing protein [Thermodesulfovibrionales bacterium]
MSGLRAVIVSADMVTPYGKGTDACWNNILSGRTAIARLNRFNTKAFQSDYAATIDSLKYHQGDSLVMQMLKYLFDKASVSIPEDAKLILATTKGEIDLLEKNILKGAEKMPDCSLTSLLKKVSVLTGVKDAGVVVSAACASSSAAVARAAAMIRSKRSDCVLVVACDSVTEFVFSGFSSLMALDKFTARPFDKNRKGLSLGEAAAFVLLMSETRAKQGKREILGEIAGWGLSDDANHMTGPSRESEGLMLAIKKALKTAAADKSDIGFISAHGTGTVYNDAMEMRAFHSIFKDKKIPVYSIKGGIGHTMGAAGIIETIIAMKSLKERNIPPTVNLKDADEDARGWVSPQPCPADERKLALLTNAGFSGINAALVIR